MNSSEKRTGRSYSETRLAKLLTKRIRELRLRKSQRDIATEAGFIHPNMLSMFKNGSSRPPLDRVMGLAKALESVPVHLFLMALEQLGGDTTDLAIRLVFGTLVTQNEVVWLEEIRTASGHTDPGLTMKARAASR